MKGPFTSSNTAAALLATYLVVLGMIVFAARLTDLGIPQAAETGLEQLHKLQLVPGIRFGHVEAGANVLLFIPVGLLLASMLRRRHWWLAMASGVITSLSIELVQAAALSGRIASPRDVVCNTLGTIVGTLIALIVSPRPTPLLTRTAKEKA